MPSTGTIGEVKDIVREHFSRTNFPTLQLDIALAEGRRIIEHHSNFWWMRTSHDFTLVIDQGSYSITTSTSSGLNKPNFKDAIAFLWALPSEVRFNPTELGTEEKEDLDILYDSDDIGNPEVVVIDDETLVIYPSKPDKLYDCRFYYWTYTDNPSLNTSSDVITKRFPMALAYAAIAWGYEMYLKDFQGATYWRTLLGGQPFGRGGELAKLKKENFKRGWQDQMTLVPRLGPGRQRRRIDNIQGYR